MYVLNPESYVSGIFSDQAAAVHLAAEKSDSWPSNYNHDDNNAGRLAMIHKAEI